MAVFLEWNEKFSVGIDKFNGQHKALLKIINELYACIVNQLPQKNIEKILKKLIDYTKTHFKDEEIYMKKTSHVLIEGHVKEHRDFVNKLNEFEVKMEQNKKALSMEMLVFLKNWLLDHIMGRDKEYSPK